jgi:hypothetical protein
MKKYSSVLGALAALSLRRLPGEVKKAVPPVRRHPAAERPWGEYHVPKAVRKGKTPE